MQTSEHKAAEQLLDVQTKLDNDLSSYCCNSVPQQRLQLNSCATTCSKNDPQIMQMPSS
jgi:hypothetical protein